MNRSSHLVAGGLLSLGMRSVMRACLCALILVNAAPVVSSAPPKPSEYAVKAAYLYNFGKFIKWPADVRQNFLICVLGQDPFAGTLDSTVSGEVIAGKPAAVKRIAVPHDAAGCNILYIASSEGRRLPEILSEVKDATLTVSDIPEFAEHGGMIGFVLDSGRVRFQINLAAAQNAGLNLSSELLKVALEVKGR